MKEYGGLAQSIIQYSGGAENIIAANNCMTRVRLELADADKAEVDRIKGLKGVLGVNIDAQFQIIVGAGDYGGDQQNPFSVRGSVQQGPGEGDCGPQ